MFKLTTPNAEASLHLQHADQELTLEYFNNSWKLHIVDTSGSTEPVSGSFSTVISTKECAALLFLWGNCDNDNEVVKSQYEVLELLLKIIPINLRPIP